MMMMMTMITFLRMAGMQGIYMNVSFLRNLQQERKKVKNQCVVFLSTTAMMHQLDQFTQRK